MGDNTSTMDLDTIIVVVAIVFAVALLVAVGFYIAQRRKMCGPIFF